MIDVDVDDDEEINAIAQNLNQVGMNPVPIIPNVPPDGNFFKFENIFVISFLGHFNIFDFQTFKNVCVQQKVFYCWNGQADKKYLNVSASSYHFISFLQDLYMQFVQNCIKYVIRSGDAEGNPVTPTLRRDRVQRYNDFVFNKNTVGGAGFQCATRNFRDYIMVPVLRTKFPNTKNIPDILEPAYTETALDAYFLYGVNSPSFLPLGN